MCEHYPKRVLFVVSCIEVVYLIMETLSYLNCLWYIPLVFYVPFGMKVLYNAVVSFRCCFEFYRLGWISSASFEIGSVKVVICGMCDMISFPGNVLWY